LACSAAGGDAPDDSLVAPEHGVQSLG